MPTNTKNVGKHHKGQKSPNTGDLFLFEQNSVVYSFFSIVYTIWMFRLLVKSANKDNNAAFCKILESCFLVGSKANIQLLIFLATTLDTSVHNLSYSAAATTTPE